MNRLPMQQRTLAVLAVVLPLLALFVYLALRSGPLAPVDVTVATVESRSVTPSLFGIGTVAAQRTYRIGPTVAGRLRRLDVEVGESVKPGQQLGEMDPVDLDERLRAQEAAARRAQASQQEAQARQQHAQAQAQRYRDLLAARSTSEELAAARQQDLLVANAALEAARAEAERLRAEQAALRAQRASLRLLAPAAGQVTARLVEPGSAVVPGQTVVEVIDPSSVWIHARFDQGSASGLTAGLPARVSLRSTGDKVWPGRVLRVEPLADAVTEETLAKVTLDSTPRALPPLGELAEVTVALSEVPAAPAIPNAALRRVNGQMGVWRLDGGQTHFTPVQTGAADLDGHVQVRAGLKEGERVVVHSAKTLNEGSTLKVVEHIAGAAR